ncbi:MAG TPA: PTS sugar transporter subunit IIA [Spirochaetota bacterium]|nr:PTS sugar transporter subunit IIA [Spirochaetota bacterium]
MLSKIISKDLIFINPPISTKEELFGFLSKKAYKKGLVESAEDFEYGLIDREAQGTTELKPGISIPHAKLDVVKEPFVIITILKNPIKFSPGFGKGVELVILIGSPKLDNTYINILASVARIMDNDDFIRDLKKSDVPEDVVAYINKYSLTHIENINEKKRFLVSLTLNIKFSIKKILAIFLELDITQPVLYYGENLSMKENFGIPVFGIATMDVRSSLSESRTIQGFAYESDIAYKLYETLKNESIDITEPGVGTIFSIELGHCIGANNPNVDF